MGLVAITDTFDDFQQFDRVRIILNLLVLGVRIKLLLHTRAALSMHYVEYLLYIIVQLIFAVDIFLDLYLIFDEVLAVPIEDLHIFMTRVGLHRRQWPRQ